MQHRARGRSSDAELRYVARIVLSVRHRHKTMLKTGPTHGDGPTTSSAQKCTGPARANLRRATQAKERAEARAQESVSRLRGGGSLSPRSLGALPLSLLSASSHP